MPLLFFIFLQSFIHPSWSNQWFGCPIMLQHVHHLSDSFSSEAGCLWITRYVFVGAYICNYFPWKESFLIFHSLLLRIEMKESFSYCTAGNRNGPNGCLFVRNFHHCYKKDQEIFVCRMVWWVTILCLCRRDLLMAYTQFVKEVIWLKEFNQNNVRL
jgi:hypothetical protein